MSEEKKEQESRIKVGKLNVNKESVEDLTSGEARQVQGGAVTLVGCAQHTQQDECANISLYCDTQGGADQCLGISARICEFG